VRSSIVVASQGTLFAIKNFALLDISPSSLVLLGAPLSAGQHLDSLLEERRKELLLMSCLDFNVKLRYDITIHNSYSLIFCIVFKTFKTTSS